jgi:hypothetical protein
MADYVKKRTHIINHVRFLEAGAIARDLYDWGMLWSGQQETDGEIPMAVVLASPWGAGGKKNVVVAQKLVDVGLWDRTDSGYRIRKWAEQGNVTKLELVERRQFDRDRKAKQRKRVSDPCPTGTPTGTPVDFPSSTFNSSSGSGSSLGRDTDPDRSPTQPEWWLGAIASAEQAVGGTIDQPGARWLEYDAARERRGWSRNHRDAVGWLTTVVRSERKNAKVNPKPAEITKQPFDENAPWMQDDYTGALKKTGST